MKSSFSYLHATLKASFRGLVVSMKSLSGKIVIRKVTAYEVLEVVEI